MLFFEPKSKILAQSIFRYVGNTFGGFVNAIMKKDEATARIALYKASAKLPIKTKFIKRF